MEILYFLILLQVSTCTIVFMPRQVLTDEQEVAVKENIIYRLAIQLQPLRHLLANAIGRTQKVIEGEFPCSDARAFRSASPPTSVHQLMPGDIDVIAAMGDSLTAGMGASASTNVGSLIEDRGFTWSIGGQGTWRDSLTLPNILLQFNPNLIGFSTGTGQVWSLQSGFNVAEPGALGIHMPYMARKLVEKIRRDKRIHFDTDWKFVTLKIGHNDACSEMCYLPRVENILTMMRIGLKDALEYLSKNLPRSIINIVPISRLEVLPSVDLPASCYLTNTVFCPCIFGPIFRKNKQRFLRVVTEIRNIFSEVVNEGRYDDRDDFAVVLQPFPINMKLPTKFSNTGEIEADVSIFAPDCFHYSQLGYARVANAFWNNILEPVGLKYESWNPLMERFLCPTKEYPYIFTRKNSKFFNSTILKS